MRGSVTKNIAKFEKRREEAELERERSISPKRSPVRRGKSGSGRSPGRPRSALSPERKPGSPERRVKHRVSWGDDQIVQVGVLLDDCFLLASCFEIYHETHLVFIDFFINFSYFFLLILVIFLLTLFITRFHRFTPLIYDCISASYNES